MSGQERQSNNLVAVSNKLRSEGSLFDAVIKVGEVEFPVHKLVLCGCTEFFQAYFTRWCNPEQSVFPISGLSPETMQRILDFAYTGSMSITADNVQETMIAADQYNIMGAVHACYEFLVGVLHPNNCIGIWKFTNVCPHAELRCRAFRCILERFEAVVYCDEFLLLTQEELVDIIQRDDLNVQTEAIVFEAVLRWIDNNPEERERHFPALLTKVRLALLDEEYIRTTVLTNPLVQNSKKCIHIVNTASKISHRTVRSRGSPISTSNPMARPRMPSAVLLAIGGWSGGNPTNAIEAYDIRANTWIDVTDELERPRAYHGAAFLNGYVYCVGGFDRLEHFSSVRKFNLLSRTWLEAAPMNFCRCYVSVTVLNGCIYAMGGFDGHVRLKSAEHYRPEINQWSPIAPMHVERSDASCTTFQGKIYICGGFNGQQCLETAEYYSPETDQWTTITPMSCRRSGVGVIAYEGLIYAVGGFDGNNRLRTVEAYNPRTRTWQDVASMITPRSNFGIEVIDGYLFVVGGFNGLTTTFNVEYYSAATNRWTDARDMEIFRSAVSCCVISRIPNIIEYTAARQPQRQLEEEEGVLGSTSSSQTFHLPTQG